MENCLDFCVVQMRYDRVPIHFPELDSFEPMFEQYPGQNLDKNHCKPLLCRITSLIWKTISKKPSLLCTLLVSVYNQCSHTHRNLLPKFAFPNQA